MSAIGGDTVSATANFETLTDPFRPELLAHCYRMLGSIHDAEDLVQETYLRAWRAYDRFEGRSSLRQWLYKIATRVCLTAIDSRQRRPLPSGLGAPTDDHRGVVATPDPAIAWIEPAPGDAFGDASSDPAAIITARASVRLAFVAALQELSARQRAVLILRDVLAWRAAEVADVLGTTTTAVHSALRRARAQLTESALTEDDIVEPGPEELRALLDQYVTAFERSDLDALLNVLRADVELEMPPIPTWFTGRTAVAGFFAANVFGRAGNWRMMPTRANGQPALAAYQRSTDGQYHAHALHVLTVLGDHVSRIVAFLEPGLLARFGLPAVLDEPARASSAPS
jgi:RNA polymerase sigma-70 factor (ECF subfamily)